MNPYATSGWIMELERRAMANGHDHKYVHYLGGRCFEQTAARGYLPDSDEHRALQALAKGSQSQAVRP